MKDNHSDDNRDHLHSSRRVSDAVPSMLHVLTSFTSKTNAVLLALFSSSFYTAETRMQRDEITCPGPHDKQVAELGVQARQSGSGAGPSTYALSRLAHHMALGKPLSFSEPQWPT